MAAAVLRRARPRVVALLGFLSLVACTAGGSSPPQPQVARSPSTATPTPESAPARPPAGTRTTVAIVGDVMLGRRVGARMAATGDFTAPFRDSWQRLARADITVGNLESTLSRAGPPQQGGDSFGADPRALTGLRRAGFDVLSVANNHVGDFGATALARTVRAVRGARITPVGAGADAAEAGLPAIVERNGIRFGFLAFNAIGETPAAGPRQPGAVTLRMQPRLGPLDRADLRTFLAAVRELRRAVDVLIVLPHWGQQYTGRPVADQRTVARALLDAGADLVAGSHPHWVQSAELYRGRLVAYSLGNFVFDQDFSRQTQEGVLLELVCQDRRITSAHLVAARIGGPAFTPRLLSPRAAAPILRRVWPRDSITLAAPAPGR